MKISSIVLSLIFLISSVTAFNYPNIRNTYCYGETVNVFSEDPFNLSGAELNSSITFIGFGVQVSKPNSVYFVDQQNIDLVGGYNFSIQLPPASMSNEDSNFTIYTVASNNPYGAYIFNKTFLVQNCLVKKLYKPADLNNNCLIEDIELLSYINLWLNSKVTDTELINTIMLWTTFEPYC